MMIDKENMLSVLISLQQTVNIVSLLVCCCLISGMVIDLKGSNHPVVYVRVIDMIIT